MSTSKEMLKYYWGVLIRDLLSSVCDNCSGTGCKLCSKGKRLFMFDDGANHYALPLFLLGKVGVHEFLKNVSEEYPIQANGKPYSMKVNQIRPPDIGSIMDFFKWIEHQARISGIKLHIKEDGRYG